MGRAFYSQTYAAPAPVVTIRTEPEIAPPCERWTSWSHFDPDSEEFFQDAEYEAFIDPTQLAREQLASRGTTMVEVDGDGDASSDSSESSESSASADNADSPMAIGADDPATLIAEVYTNRTARWNNRSSELVSPTDPEWSPQTMIPGSESTSNMPSLFEEAFSPTEPLFDATATSPTSQRNPPFIPPPLDSDELHTPTLRRITPITITRTQTQVSDADDGSRRSESPDSPAPTTPTSSRTPFFPPSNLVSPFPPPSVSPRFYSWQHHAIPSLPTLSPSHLRGVARDGPLTNHRARISHIRIDHSPARIRIPSTVM